jgi:MFS family permease
MVNCDKTAVIVLLLLGMFLYGFFSGGEYPTIAEYAADLSGTIFGVSYTIAPATGFIGPLIVGLLLEHGVSIYFIH